jgi:hypothetical protein
LTLTQINLTIVAVLSKSQRGEIGRERRVSITPFLEGQRFDAEQIDVMSAAFVDVCKALSLSETEHHRTTPVARYVIELGQRGFRNKTVIYFLALKEFRSQKQRDRRLALLLTSITALAWAVIVALGLNALGVSPTDIRTYALGFAASVLVALVGAARLGRA